MVYLVKQYAYLYSDKKRRAALEQLLNIIRIDYFEDTGRLKLESGGKLYRKC